MKKTFSQVNGQNLVMNSTNKMWIEDIISQAKQDTFANEIYKEELLHQSEQDALANGSLSSVP